MTTLTFTEKQKNGLIKKFHTLCGRVRLRDDNKEMMLIDNYGVRSSSDLSVMQLIEICNTLDCQLNPHLVEMDKHRKRLIASIGGWLRVMGNDESIDKIKAIACRAAKREKFNDIPMEQLRSLYNAFRKMGKDMDSVTKLTEDILLDMV